MSQTFRDLGVSAPVAEALGKRGIITPFAIQTLVMEDALAQHDVLAKSRTGSGKTLGFVLPIVENLRPGDPQPSAVILTPTRELALQVTDEFVDVARIKNLRVTTVYGGASVQDQARLAGRAHIIVATPGRLEDLANRGMVGLGKVKVLVLDEADRMLDMGFQPQVNRLVTRMPTDRQTMFFSATLDGDVGRLARRYTRDARRHEVESPMLTVEEVEHRFLPVTTATKVLTLATELKEDRGLALVFVRTKRGADRLVTRLKNQGIKAVAMHGDLTQGARQKALARFEAGQVTTLVATDVAARGLDLDDITHVINFDPPDDDKSYVHRVGRTARAGRNGTGVTLVLPDQRADVSRMAARLQLDKEFQDAGMTIAPPTVVYSSHRGRNSMLAPPRRKRRF